MSETNYVGQTIDGRYKIVSLLGKGGMGSVYLGQHVMLGKKVAVKFLHTQFVQKDELIARFYREARAATEIGHKNIADVMDMGVSANGEPFIVMEYLEGESLAKLLRRTGPMNLSATCGVLEPVLFALDAAHEKGIVHRDLKPENVFLAHQNKGELVVKLIDFGVSKFTQNATQTGLTSSGALLGTPAYMSPEQVRGAGEIDHRADVYSIGVMMYEMLAGRLPFDGTLYHEQLAAALSSDPRPPREAYADFPVQAEDLVLKLLNKKADDRPQTVQDVLNTLSQMDGYENRVESLRRYTSAMVSKTVCGGDLGDFETSDSKASVPSASDYVQLVKGTASGGTPGQWTETGPGTNAPWSKKKKLIAISSSAAIIVLGFVLFLLVGGPSTGDDSKPADDVQTASSSSSETKLHADSQTPKYENVQIDVRGAPENAKIFYDKIPVPMNPFRVEIKDNIVSIRIEAEGFRPFVTSVVPSEDQVVKVEMSPIDEPSEIPEVEQAEVVDPPVPTEPGNSTQDQSEQPDSLNEEADNSSSQPVIKKKKKKKKKKDSDADDGNSMFKDSFE